MSSDAVLLRTEDLYKTYPSGRVRALSAVSLAVQRGEYVAIMGPSGSGKSTLLNMLGALDQPDQGEVFFEEQPLSKIRDLDRFRSEKLGFVFQSFFLLPTLTAVENVQIPMLIGRLSARARAQKSRDLLADVGLSQRAKHYPEQLSIGERQRVAIARALANDPCLMLADEPTGNLDSQSAGEILDLFARLRTARGLTLVVITHSESLARQADRTIHLRDGRTSDGQNGSAIRPA